MPLSHACSHRLMAWATQASSSDAVSSPATGGRGRRGGTTPQFVVASRNSPIGFLNGTRSHWKWKRASSRYTRNENAVSTRNVPICASISVLRQLVAQLAAAPGGRGERLAEPLGQLLFLEHPQGGLGGAALGRHVLA